MSTTELAICVISLVGIIVLIRFKLRKTLYPEVEFFPDDRRQLIFRSAVKKVSHRPAWLLIWATYFVYLACTRGYEWYNPGSIAQLGSWGPALVSFGPLYALFLLTAVPFSRQVRRLLRELLRGMNLCPDCGYDLTGNVSGRCSECGATIEKPEPTP